MPIALKFNHASTIEYFIKKSYAIGAYHPSKIIYYAYKARREDIICQINIEEPVKYADTYKYYGLIASERGHLMPNYTVSEFELGETFSLAMRHGVQNMKADAIIDLNVYAPDTELYRAARYLIYRGDTEYLYCYLRKLISSQGYCINKHLFEEQFGDLYEIAYKYDRNVNSTINFYITLPIDFHFDEE